MTGRVKRCRAFHYALKSSSVLKISQQLARSRAKIQTHGHFTPVISFHFDCAKVTDYFRTGRVVNEEAD